MKQGFIRQNVARFTMLVVGMVLTISQVSGQHGWSYNYADFANNADVSVAVVYLNGVPVTEGALGAFVADECRGFDEDPETPPFLLTDSIFSFPVYSNVASGETVNFKYYNPSDGITYDIVESVEFISDAIYGSLFSPLILNAISNAAPTVSSPIADQVYDEHFSSSTIDISSVFSDSDGDALSYSASSSSGSVVSVSVSGTDLIITEVGLGTSSITVTADDGLATVDDVFTVTVNNVNDAPILANPIADRSPNEGFSSIDISLTAVFSDPDGNPLTYSAVSSNVSVVTVSVSGSTLTITEVAPGTANVTVTASDGSLTADDVFAVDVNNVNDAPVVDAAIPDQTLDEHFTTTTIDLTGVFSDPDGDALTLTPSTSNPLVVTVGISGMTLTLIEQGIGSSTITITASDGSLSVNDAFNVTVNNVNDAPVVDNPVPNQTESEHFTSTVIDVSSVFSDPDGDGLSLSATSSNTSVVTASVTGTTLTIVEVGVGVSTITLTASDGSLFNTDAFSFTVTNVNDAPYVVTPINDQNLDEHFTSTDLDLTGVFADPDGTALTLSAVTSNSSVVTVSTSGNTLTITEAGLGTANITVTASDGSLSASDVFSVTVSNVNDAPTVANPVVDQVLSEHFTSSNLNLSTVFTDPDGDALTITAVSSDIGVVTVSVSGTTLTLTEQGLGSSTITLTASDGSLNVTDDFLVTVNNVNDAPVIDNPVPDQVLDEHFTSTTIDLSSVFSDPDGDALTISPATSNPAVVTVGISGTTLTLTEAGIGTATITLTASDGSLTAVDAFTVTINNVNDAPVVDNEIADQNLNEHFGTSSINLSATFSDPDGDALTITPVSSNTGIVTVSMSGNTLTITEQGLGTATVTVTADDGSLSVSDVFTVTVTNVNDAPLVVSATPDQLLNEHFGTRNIDISGVFSDPDGDALILSVSSSNINVVTAGITGTTLTLTEQGVGTSTVTVSASDGSLSTNDVFTVTVANVNDDPVVVTEIPDRSYSEGFGSSTINLSTYFSDPDGDVLSYTATSGNTSIVSVSVSGAILTITEEGLGTTNISVTASDGTLTANDTFQVTVNNVNDAPVVANPVPDQSEDEHFSSTTINLASVFSDPDGDALTISASSSDTDVISVSVSGTTLTITEQGVGTANVTLNANDGSLGVNDVFVFTVINVNDAPVVQVPLADLNLVEHFTTRNVNLSSTFSDPDNDVLSLAAVSSSTGVATVTISGTTLTIIEQGIGATIITVTASDGTLTANEQFIVDVANVNDPPVVDTPVPDQILNEHFGSADINLSATFTDPDNDNLTLTAVSSNTSVISVSISGNILTLTEEGLGNATVTVTATDDGVGDLSVSDQFAVAVNNINDAPVVSSAINDRVLDEGFSTSSISLGPVFTDPDGDVLLFTAISSNTSVVSVSIVGTTLIITEEGLGNATVLVSATDGFLNASDNFNVTVNNVNDQPVIDNPIADRVYNEYFTSATINLSAVFSDPDASDVLTLTASSNNTSVAGVSVSGTDLIITENGLGSALITVTATDNGSPVLHISDQFNVTVNNVNDAPVVDNPVPDQSADEYFGSRLIALANVFSDKDGDAIILSAVSSNNSVVSVSMSGSDLTVTEQGLGTATITVTASDGSLSVNDVFSFIVNNVNDAPIVDNPIPNQSFNERFTSATISLASVFSDQDGDALSLSVLSSNTAVVSASISGTTLTITEAGLGSATITVTASDGSLSVSDIFTVTVNNVNDAPVVDNPISDRTVLEYFSTLNIDLSNVFSDPDVSDILTLSATSSDTDVVSVLVSGNTLTVYEVGLGTSTITVTATDNGNGNLSVNEQFNVTVNNVNDAPVVDNPVVNQVYSEYFASNIINLSTVFSDKDGDAIQLTALSSNTSVVSVSISGNQLTITEQGLGVSTITVTASDGSLSVDDQFTVTVTNVNDAPSLDNPIADQSFPEYFNSHTIDLSSVFSDKDGDVILLSASSDDTNIVTVTISGSNLIVLEQGLGIAGITVTASDGSLSTSDLFDFEVTNVNDAPVVVNPLSSISTNEGFASTTIDLTPVFTDPDGDALTYSAISSNNNVVTVSVSGSTLTITEVNNGSSNITVTASDGSLTNNDQFTFAIDNVNDQPEIVRPIGDRDLFEGFTSQSINLLTIFSDPDGDVLSFTASSSNTSVVSVSISGSTLTITEVGLGSSTLTVTASDGTLSNSDVAVINVNNVNDAPVLENPIPNQVFSEYFVSQDINLSSVFSDPDGDVLTITALSSNMGVASVSVTGSILTITENGLGTTTVTVTASDGSLSVSDQFTVTVNNVNDSPVVVTPLPDRSYQEGFGSASLSLAAVFSDQDGDVLALTATSSDTDIVAVSITGSTLTLSERGLGTVLITVSASDGTLSVSDQFEVVVNNVNDQPVVVNPLSDRVLNEHFSTLDIDLATVFDDPDLGDQLSLSAQSSDASVVSVSISGTTLTITEVGLGTANITVTATDDGDGNLGVDDLFMVTVNNVNDAPLVQNPISNRDLDEYFGSLNVNLVATFSDPDNDALSYSAVSSAPAIVGVSVSGSTLTLTEAGLGTATITVTASDGSLSTDTQFMVTVNNVNDAPVVENPISDLSVDEYFSSTSIDLASVFSDKDGDDLTITASSSNTSFVSVSLSGTSLTITEEGLGVSTITVTASDGSLSVNDVFTVTVNNVNDPPVVENPIGDREVDEYFGEFVIDITSVFSDKDGDILSISASSSNNSIVGVSVAGNSIILSEGTQLGTTTVTVMASDGQIIVSEEFDILVNNVNDAPSIDNPIADQTEPEYFGSTTVDLSSVFSDKDGDAITLSASSNNTSVVTVSVSGTLLTVTEVGLGSATITVSATDNLLSTDDLFEFTVSNVNDPPQVDNEISDRQVDEHFSSTNISLSGVFSDKDGDVLTLSATSGNTDVVDVIVDGTQLVVTETGLGSSVITITASDGSLSVDEQFIITVNNVNDAPVIVNSIGDLSLDETFTTHTIDVADVFEDPDGDALTLTATSGATDVVTVAISGTDLVITEVAKGLSTIALTASDGTLSNVEYFVISVDDVNFAPVVDSTMDAVQVPEHEGIFIVDFEGVFSDPDGDDITYSISSADDEIASASLTDTLSIIVTGHIIGSTTITLIANDGELSTETTFNVEVTNVNDSPVVYNPFIDMKFVEGFAEYSVELDTVFTDPDGDTLSYSVVNLDRRAVTASLVGSMLVLTEDGIGEARIIITAGDGEYNISDTLAIIVEEVNALQVFDGEEEKVEGDTIQVCNEAGEKYLSVQSQIGWSYSSSNPGWYVLEKDTDSTLYIGYSPNLSGVDRFGEITVIDDQGHEIKLVIEQSECTGIEDLDVIHFKTYPNPVKSLLNVEVESHINGTLLIEVIDMNGKVHIQQVEYALTGIPMQIDMSDFRQGVYLIRLSDGERNMIRKVVKQ